MPRSDGNRIVLEIDPDLKKRLYDRLDQEGLTLKDWFFNGAVAYLQEHNSIVGRRVKTTIGPGEVLKDLGRGKLAICIKSRYVVTMTKADLGIDDV